MVMVSIIVPVYKVEQYLSKCIESVLAQTMTDWELILVDDGSPDRCGEICDEYAGKYPNIRVIHKENEGLPMARKSGLKVAEGKYFAFLDSDDWVEPDMYAQMVAKAEQHQADMVAVGFVRDEADAQHVCTNAMPSGVYTEETLADLLDNAFFSVPQMRAGVITSIWTKLFLRQSAQQSLLDEPNTQNFGEDAIFVYPFLFRSKCIVVDNENCAYHYLVRDSSIIHTYRESYFGDLFSLYEKLEDRLRPYESEVLMMELSYGYVFSYADGIYRLIGRGNRAGIRQKYQMLKRISQNDRLKESLKYVDLTKLPGDMARDMESISKNHLIGFLSRSYVSAVLRKIKAIFR